MAGWFDWAKGYPHLLAPENQERVRSDLKTFFGPRAEIFLNTYDKLCAKKAVTWCWPAFLTAFVWFFYRKMYLIGAAIILLPVILGLVFGGTGSSAATIAIAVLGKVLYVQTGLGRIVKADELGLTGDKRADYLQRAGGVSWPAGIFAGIIFAAAAAVVVAEIIEKLQGS